MRSIATIKTLKHQSIEPFALSCNKSSWYCGIIRRVYLKQMERHFSCALYDVQPGGASDRHKGRLMKIYLEVINAMTNSNVPRKRHSLGVDDIYWCYFIRRTFCYANRVSVYMCVHVCYILPMYWWIRNYTKIHISSLGRFFRFTKQWMIIVEHFNCRLYYFRIFCFSK